jgi:hypothetical protein
MFHGNSEGEYVDKLFPDKGSEMAAMACCVDVAACSIACMKYRPSGLRNLGTAIDYVKFLPSEGPEPSAFIVFDDCSMPDSSLSPFILLFHQRITLSTGS